MKKISVIGIGKLGLCLALCLEKNGYNVVGMDIDKDYIVALKDKKFRSNEIGVNDMLESTHFMPTDDLIFAIEHGDVIFVTVRTGSEPDGSYNESQLTTLVEQIKQYGKVGKRKDLIISCNVNPGCSDTVNSILSPLGYVISYNPEWVAQGEIIKYQTQPDVVVIGAGDLTAAEIITNIHKSICSNDPIIHIMDRKSAEIVKIAVNSFLATKIASANLIGEIAVSAGCDPHAILNAVGEDSRIGHKYLNYGFGYSGPCFPRDTGAFIRFADSMGIKDPLHKAVEDANEQHLQYLIKKKLIDTEEGETVVMDYVTYKPNVDMLDFSHRLRYAIALADAKRHVVICETSKVIELIKYKYGDIFSYREKTS